MPLIALGVALEAIGILFALQGAGLVRWPASSFMIDQPTWLYIGVALALVGNVVMFLGLRRRRK